MNKYISLHSTCSYQESGIRVNEYNQKNTNKEAHRAAKLNLSLIQKFNKYNDRVSIWLVIFNVIFFSCSNTSFAQ